MFSLGVSDTIWTGIIDQVRAAVSIPCIYLTFYHPTRDIFDDESVQYVLSERSYFILLLFINTCRTKICFACGGLACWLIIALSSPI
jgi:hypothetical protein